MVGKYQILVEVSSWQKFSLAEVCIYVYANLMPPTEESYPSSLRVASWFTNVFVLKRRDYGNNLICTLYLHTMPEEQLLAKRKVARAARQEKLS
jgi:hypothetical protein